MLAKSRLAHWWSLGALAVLLAGAGLVALQRTRLAWVLGVTGAWVAAGYLADRRFLYSLAGAVHEHLFNDGNKAAAWSARR